jgi:hypothetical protein
LISPLRLEVDVGPCGAYRLSPHLGRGVEQASTHAVVEAANLFRGQAGALAVGDGRMLGGFRVTNTSLTFF